MYVINEFIKSGLNYGLNYKNKQLHVLLKYRSDLQISAYTIYLVKQ